MRFTDQSYETRNHRNFIPSKGKSFGTDGRAGTGSFLGLVILKSKSCAPMAAGVCCLESTISFPGPSRQPRVFNKRDRIDCTISPFRYSGK